MTVHVTISLDDADKARVEKIAAHEGLSPEALIQQLVQDRLAYDAWFVQEVQKGLQSAAEGRLVAHDEAIRRLHAHMSAVEARSSR